MSWMAKLYATYEQGLKLNLSDEEKLMPISHTLQNAHINIVIDENGNFKRASVLEKMQIILPATETSAGRSSGGAPHPLADKLQYVAKDYANYGGKKTPYFHDFEVQTKNDCDYIDAKTKKPMREGYITKLKKWCDSSFSHPKAKAIYQYITKGEVIADLIREKIVYVDSENKLLTKWPYEVTSDKPLPLLFKVLPKDKGEIEQGSALVCWTVETESDPNTDTWTDPALHASWIAFNASLDAMEGLCYVVGEKLPIAINHPAKLRHTGDKAKLISANDSAGMTYRGRFEESEQACTVSFDVTQKAHNALRWLISRQGQRNGDQVIVTWSISNKKIPDIAAASYEFLDYDDMSEAGEDEIQLNKIDHSRDLGQLFAKKLGQKMEGYRADLGDFENIIIMAIDSATPGRMGITYYQEYFSKEFIARIELWHSQFAWQQRYVKKATASNSKKSENIVLRSISAPSFYAIAETAYGKTLTDSLKKSLYERLIPCVVEAAPLPVDLVNACVARASNPNNGENWEWERNLGVACALYRGFYLRHPIQSKRRNYSVELETSNYSRDYLYGRLLAIAERIERVALSTAKENRATTAERLMQRFADRPYSTWRNIELALRPYMQRLQNNRAPFLVDRQKEIDEIMCAFKHEEFISDKKLSGEFLLGYHCQRQAAYKKSNDGENENLEISETTV